MEDEVVLVSTIALILFVFGGCVLYIIKGYSDESIKCCIENLYQQLAGYSLIHTGLSHRNTCFICQSYRNNRVYQSINNGRLIQSNIHHGWFVTCICKSCEPKINKWVIENNNESYDTYLAIYRILSPDIARHALTNKIINILYSPLPQN